MDYEYMRLLIEEVQSNAFKMQQTLDMLIEVLKHEQPLSDQELRYFLERYAAAMDMCEQIRRFNREMMDMLRKMATEDSEAKQMFSTSFSEARRPSRPEPDPEPKARVVPSEKPSAPEPESAPEPLPELPPEPEQTLVSGVIRSIRPSSGKDKPKFSEKIGRMFSRKSSASGKSRPNASMMPPPDKPRRKEQLENFIRQRREEDTGVLYHRPREDETLLFCMMDEGSAAPEAPPVEVTKVDFSAVAPKTLTKDEYAMIHVVMYEKSAREVVDELLRSAEGQAQEVRGGVQKVSEGASVRIRLDSPDIPISDNEETAVWNGEYLDFSFAVSLPEDYRKAQVLFTATVWINDLMATRMKFVARCQADAAQKLTVRRKDIVSAFVSYASQDRNRVAAIIQGMKKARPDLDLFFDVESLRSGENWEEALKEEIGKRDILFLCWSHYAKASTWVDTEWRYAFNLKGPDCIEPVPIEPPDLCPPPKELMHKHFNDKLLYIINADNHKF